MKIEMKNMHHCNFPLFNTKRGLGGVLLLFLSSFIFIAPTTARADITTGLVGWWELNDGGSSAAAADSSGPYDSGIINAGTLENGPIWANDTRMGETLQFNTNSGTDQYIQLPNTVPQPANVITLTLWVYPTTGAVSGTNQSFFEKVGSYGLRRMDGPSTGYNDNFAVVLFTSGNNSSTNFGAIGGTVMPNRWNFVAMTYDGTTNTLYVYPNASGTGAGSVASTIDPNAITNSSFTGNLQPSSSNPPAIGTCQGSGCSFTGGLHDVRIYNRVLSSWEIAAIYNAAPPDTTPPNIVPNSIKVSNISSSSAAITWTTDIPSTTQVKWDTQANYNSAQSLGNTTSETDQAPMVLTHTVNLSGLSSDTVYSYEVISTTPAGSSPTVSSLLSFTTGSAANNIIGSVTENSPLPLVLQLGQSGSDDKSTIRTLTTRPLHGAVFPDPAYQNADGSTSDASKYIYMPRQNYYGPDTFTFQGGTGSTGSTVNITVNKVPQVPVFTDDFSNIVFVIPSDASGASQTFQIPAKDVNGDALSYTITSGQLLSGWTFSSSGLMTANNLGVGSVGLVGPITIKISNSDSSATYVTKTVNVYVRSPQNWYVGQYGGSVLGTSCASAISIDTLSNSWDSQSGTSQYWGDAMNQIGPGDTIHFCQTGSDGIVSIPAFSLADPNGSTILNGLFQSGVLQKVSLVNPTLPSNGALVPPNFVRLTQNSDSVSRPAAIAGSNFDKIWAILQQKVITSPLQILGSGIAGYPITIQFDQGGTIMSAPYWPGYGAIYAFQKNLSYIVINGVQNTDGSTNGIIESTDNGTATSIDSYTGELFTNQQQSVGIDLHNLVTNFTIENMTIRNNYVRTPDSFDAQDWNRNGIAINVSSASNLTIQNNILTEGDTMIGLTAGDNCVISGNTLLDFNHGISTGPGGGIQNINTGAVSKMTFEMAFPNPPNGQTEPGYGDAIYNWLVSANPAYLDSNGNVIGFLTSSSTAAQAQFTDPNEFQTIANILQEAYMIAHISGGTNPMARNLTVSNNRLDGWDSWECPGCPFYGIHNDAMIVMNESTGYGGAIINFNIFGNEIGPEITADPNFGGSGSAAFFFDAYSPTQLEDVYIYNNLIAAKKPVNWADGDAGAGGKHVLFANNTFAGGGAVGAGGIDIHMYNNLLYQTIAGNKIQAFYVDTGNLNNDININNNVYYLGQGIPSDSQAFGKANPGSCSGIPIDFSQWHGLGYDVSGSLSQPSLDADYIPDSNDSIARDQGINLELPMTDPNENYTINWCAPDPTQTIHSAGPGLCFDKNGFPRPASSPWDIGAYQYNGNANSISINRNPPTGGNITCGPTPASNPSNLPSIPGGACPSEALSGTQVTFVAVPKMGYAVSGWTITGSSATCATGTCTVTITAPTTVTANFTPTGNFSAPGVSITAPSNGVTVSGSLPVTISAAAVMGQNPIQSVQFYIWGNNNYYSVDRQPISSPIVTPTVATANGGTYSYQWNTYGTVLKTTLEKTFPPLNPTTPPTYPYADGIFTCLQTNNKLDSNGNIQFNISSSANLNAFQNALPTLCGVSAADASTISTIFQKSRYIGSYVLTAVVTDTAGVVSYSNSSNVTIAMPSSAAVNGQCGSANGKIYDNGTATFSTDNLCRNGLTYTADGTTPTPIVSFPAAGASQSWICQGINGTDGTVGTNASCAASQAAGPASNGATGDVSGNGPVTMYDAALALIDYAAGGGCSSTAITAQPTGACARAGMDPQGTTGSVDSADVIDIAKKAMGL